MPEKRCTTCGQPMKACQCPLPALPDTLGRVMQLQQAERARRIAPVSLLMGYAEWGPSLPEECRDDIKALCEHVYRTLCPPRSHGGRPADMTEAAFRQGYFDAYHKLRLAAAQGRGGRVTQAQVARQLLMSPSTFYRLRRKYRLPWPPSLPN